MDRILYHESQFTINDIKPARARAGLERSIRDSILAGPTKSITRESLSDVMLLDWMLGLVLEVLVLCSRGSDSLMIERTHKQIDIRLSVFTY